MLSPAHPLDPRHLLVSLDPRTRDIIQAASLLEISEYDFLSMAYLEWYGKEADPDRLSKIFGRYMYGHNPPFWGHRLAAEVLSLDAAGELENSRFNARPPLHANMNDIITGLGQTLVLLAIIIILFESMINL